MNQQERIKAYKQQRQRADENKKKQRDGIRKTQIKHTNTKETKVRKNVSEKKMGTSRKAQAVQKNSAKRQEQSISIQGSTVKRQTQQLQRSTVKRQTQQLQRSTVKRQTQQLQRSTVKRQTQQLQKNIVTKQTQQDQTNNVRKKKLARADAVKRAQTAPVHTKNSQKTETMSMADVAKKVSQVISDVGHGIQGAVYYVSDSLEKAKEREEREEREENYQDDVWGISYVGEKNIERKAQNSQESLRSHRQNSRTSSKNSLNKRLYKKKQGTRKDWLQGERRLQVIVTACAVIIVLVVGGGGISSFGHSNNDSYSENNPIRNLINMMDFANSKDEKNNEQNNDIAENETGSFNFSNETGITGNYTMRTASGKVVDISRIVCPSWIDRQFLTVNKYSRPGIILDSIESIVIHYVGNPSTTAQNNRDYFERLKDTQEASKSSHFVVGLEGEIIQCIPLNEKSYASNHRNSDTISIEVCHPYEDGKFTDVTYDSVVKLTAWLCEQFGLTDENIIRHYDVTEKICPKYFVDYPEEWTKFKEDVMNYMEENPNIK